MGVHPFRSPEWRGGAHGILNAEEDGHYSLYTQSIIADFFFGRTTVYTHITYIIERVSARRKNTEKQVFF